MSTYDSDDPCVVLFESLEPRLLLDAVGLPWLAGVLENSVYVSLEATDAETATVDYGLDASYGGQATTESTQSAGSSDVHNVKLTGLLPNTEYHYRVTQGASVSDDYSFWTAPEPGTDARWGFAADSRTRTEIHDEIVGVIDTFDPKMMVYGGDLCADPTYDSWKNEWFVPNQEALNATTPWVNSPGNHEDWGELTRAFTQSPTGDPDYFSFDYGDAHILILNTEIADGPGSDLWNFAAADLAATTQTWKLVAFHKPAYSAGSHSPDADMLAMTSAIFEPNGVDIVLAGHNHYYQHNVVNDIHHMVLGSFGGPLSNPGSAWYTQYAEKTECFAIFDTSPSQLTMTTYRGDGSVLETIVLTVSPPEFVGPIADLVVDEDDPDTVIDLSLVFGDADLGGGDALTYSVDFHTPTADIVGQISEPTYTHVHQDLLYTHAGDDRGFGPEHNLARDNIFNWFEDAGLQTSLRPFQLNSQTYYNVVGVKPGATDPDDIFVVGAHYDSLNNPGADDNGSGTAALMEAARVLSPYEFENTIVFIAFDREGQGLAGSTAYVAAHRGDNILGMVNLDMIAYNPAGPTQDTVRLFDWVPGGTVKQDLIDAFAAYGNGVTALDLGQNPQSAHRPFEDEGFDAAGISEYEIWTNPEHYLETDAVETPGYIDYGYATNITSAAVGYIVDAAVSADSTGLLTATVDADQLTLDYAAGQNGVVEITVRATDTGGLFAEDTFLVTVNPLSDDPLVAAPIDDVTVHVSAPDTVVDLSAHFADTDVILNGDWLTFSITANTNPALVTPAADAFNLTLDYEPGLDGAATVTVRATDAAGAFVEDTFLATVDPGLPQAEIIIDNDDASGVTVTGDWTASSSAGSFRGIDYLHDDDTDKGTKSVRFTPTLTNAGNRQVFLWFPSDSTHAASVPVDIIHSDGAGGTTTDTATVDQTTGGGAEWASLGIYLFDAGTTGSILIRTDDTSGHVVADAVRLTPASDEPTEVIIDNNSPTGVTVTGDWTTSTLQPDNRYGANYVHDGNTEKGTKSVEFTPTLTAAGTYEVYLWWTHHSNRATNVPVDIIHSDGAGGTTTNAVTVDQTTGGGDWVLLGIHPFDAGTTGSILIRTDDTSGYVIADAVRLTPASDEPTEVIIDNNSPTGVTVTGDWTVSTLQADNRYGPSYLHDQNADKGTKSVEFTPTLTGAGTYELYLWWAHYSNRATNVPVDIIHSDGAGGTTTDTVIVNQTQPGTQWVLLGTYAFDAGTSSSVLVRTDDTSGHVIADAARFTPTQQGTVIVDNSDASGVTITGDWTVSTFQPDNRYGLSYLHDQNADKGTKSVEFTPTLTAAGTYEVYLWWAHHSNRATDVPVDIIHSDGAGGTTTDTVTVDQTQPGAQWVLLGTYAFDAGTAGSVLVRTDATDGVVIADAVRFTPTQQGTVIVDNSDASGVTITGDWTVSTFHPDNRYGPSYLHDQNADKGTKSVEFTPTLAEAGAYEVYLWWAEYSNRATNVPVDIAHSTGTATVVVDQTQPGSDWVLLGTYAFGAGESASVLIRTDETDGHVTADAVKFVPWSGEVIIDSTTSSGVTVTGDWTTSASNVNRYGADYLHDANTGKGTKSVRFSPDIAVAGDYEVYIWYPDNAQSYATNVPVDVIYSDGVGGTLTDTLAVNQTTPGGQWELLGTYAFDVGTAGSVLIRTAGTDGVVIADAVRFVLL